MTIHPKDPVLTTYVLGELDDLQRRRVEDSLARDEACRKAVDEIRATVRGLEAELAAEDAPRLTEIQRRRIERLARRGSTRPRRWPRVAGLAAAAVVATALALMAPRLKAPQPDLPRQGAPAPGQSGSAGDVAAMTVRPKQPASRSASADRLGAVDGDARASDAAPRIPPPRSEPLPSPPLAARRPAEALAKAPGIAGGGDGSPNVRGARERDFKSTTDGVSNVDPLSGTFMSNIDPDAAAEIEAVASGAGAEYGGAELRSLGYLVDSSAVRHYAVTVGGDAQPPTGHAHFNTEAYDHMQDNPFVAVAVDPLSTFSIDVDTASYSNVRRFLGQGVLPPPDAVRIEEMVNYFSYDYEPPRDGHPFAVHVEVARAPWAPDHRLVRLALKGRVLDPVRRPPSNLVFLLDVSGSMQPPNKLALVRRAMHLLVDQLEEGDRVAIVVYAGASGLVLPSTPLVDRGLILEALDRLGAGGSTHGSAGIRLAYEVATRNFIRGGTNRVILCTDGDFNVGVTNRGDLIRLIEDKARSGVFLSVLGFGMGNYKDATLERLADKGNGNYAYIDTLAEARKVLVEQMAGTLVTIAKDVKIQVEFNPAMVNAYRLIGYENRKLAHQDFNDDTKDAGEIGAGHTVTALYEVAPAGVSIRAPAVDPLKYQPPTPRSETEASGELLTVKLRYKPPEGHRSTKMEIPVIDEGLSWRAASDDFRFAASVAAFGMILRDSPHRGGATLDKVRRWASRSRGVDHHGYRGGFLRLVDQARRLEPRR
jgi:Ca-activated chloride channel family protein